MYSKKQIFAFIFVTTFVVGAVGMLFTSGNNRDLYEDERELGALGKRKETENKIVLNKSITFKKTTREKKEEVRPEEIVVEEKKEKPKKDKKKKKAKKGKDKKKKDEKKVGTGGVVVRASPNVLAQGQPQEIEGPNFNDNAKTPAQATYGGAGASVFNNPQQDLSENFQNLSTELIESPSLETVEKLVGAYRDKSISEADFYSLVTILLDDQDKGVRRLGLLSLYRTPGSKSFIELAKLGTSEYSELKLASESYLKQYSNYRYIDIVNSVLDDGEDSVKLAAIQAGISSAEKNIHNSVPTEDSEQPSRELSSVNEEDVDIAKYEALSNKLNQIYSSSQNEQVKAKAKEALDIVSELIATYRRS